uniref:Fibrinogen C domain-containing protein 1-like n=1 Tax=Castor canadensis TaxID=51338 RepID=A0A8B7WHQ6_CASCN|nr:fibrinogen C domain-containing protein 1-like [Castor canadensis]
MAGRQPSCTNTKGRSGLSLGHSESSKLKLTEQTPLVSLGTRQFRVTEIRLLSNGTGSSHSVAKSRTHQTPTQMEAGPVAAQSVLPLATTELLRPCSVSGLVAGDVREVFQRREDGSVNFFRGWEAYREGFGKLTGEHWLGLKRIHALTTQGAYELHVDLEDFENGTAYAHYGSFGVGLFSVDPEEDGYPLTVADYSGTAGDSLLKHSGMKFTTKDRDSDHSENNCAAFYRGAWWYRNCHTSNLNGQYLRGTHASYADGIEWSSWTGWQYSLKFAEMKIRPAREDH